jgi:hypothetical protein
MTTRPRPTRQQQLDHAAEAAKEKIAAEKRKLASIASAQREEQRKVRDRRRYQVGALCEEAGLLALDDAFLKELLALLGQVAQQADPHATVAACLRTIAGMPGTSVDAYGTAAQCVSRAD